MKINPLNIPIGSSYLVETLRESAEENSRKQDQEGRSDERHRTAESKKDTTSPTPSKGEEKTESQILDTETLLELLDRSKDAQPVPKKPFADGRAAKHLTPTKHCGKKI
ncbi:MAG: hypothetical protein KDD51_09900 [Bdellovibrionales bacterium]|nr:hypothetical protein [Bdellovibrionales bacterium]